MCVDAANCGGSCPECISDNIRRLTMANKQLTKMCDQYLAEGESLRGEVDSLIRRNTEIQLELEAERQRARMPEELVKRLIALNQHDFFALEDLRRDLLAWHEQGGGK